MSMKVRQIWNNLFHSGSVRIEENINTLLRVTVGDKHIADLYYDGAEFCLTYKPAFNEVGLPAFNPEDLQGSNKPEINRSYRSKDLWFVFAERLSALDRRDFAEEMKKLGLTKESNPLLLLGKLGRIGISKPWKLELVKKTS